MFQYLQLSGPAPQDGRTDGRTAASETHQEEAALRAVNHPGGLARRLAVTRQDISS